MSPVYGYVTKSDWFPTPRMKNCVNRIENAKYVTKITGFWQIPLTEHANKVFACVIPTGLCQYKVMSFGMKNAPATFLASYQQHISGQDNLIADCLSSWRLRMKILINFFSRGGV